jgi:hypothetical protein
MSLKVSPNGFFTELWAINSKGEMVYPHIKSKRGSSEKGFEITLNGKKEDYHIVNLEKLLSHIANGDFDNIGRVRMKPLKGGQSNGFAIRKSTMSKALLDEIANRISI